MSNIELIKLYEDLEAKLILLGRPCTGIQKRLNQLRGKGEKKYCKK